MKGYLKDLLSSMEAIFKMFSIDETIAVLEMDQKELYHSLRLLYLAKTTWPNLLTAVAYLCMLAQTPTVEHPRLRTLAPLPLHYTTPPAGAWGRPSHHETACSHWRH